MTLNQIFTGLENLGFDRYVIDNNGNPHGIKMTCFLFKPGEVTPSIVATSAMEQYALEAALKIAREPAGRPGWKADNARWEWELFQ